MSNASRALKYEPKVGIDQYILSEDKAEEETPPAPEAPPVKESKFAVRSVSLLAS